jgi:hypothetical protein
MATCVTMSCASGVPCASVFSASGVGSGGGIARSSSRREVCEALQPLSSAVQSERDAFGNSTVELLTTEPFESNARGRLAQRELARGAEEPALLSGILVRRAGSAARSIPRRLRVEWFDARL